MQLTAFCILKVFLCLWDLSSDYLSCQNEINIHCEIKDIVYSDFEETFSIPTVAAVLGARGQNRSCLLVLSKLGLFHLFDLDKTLKGMLLKYSILCMSILNSRLHYLATIFQHFCYVFLSCATKALENRSKFNRHYVTSCLPVPDPGITYSPKISVLKCELR